MIHAEIITWPDAADAPGRRKPRALEKVETEKKSEHGTLDNEPNNSAQTGEGDEGMDEKMDEDESMTSD